MTSEPLRVASYNVHRVRGDLEEVAQVLRACRADVVAIQEPPRGLSGRGRLRRLAGAAGLAVVVAGGGARTTALLARPDIAAVRRYSLRLPWRLPRTRRGLAVADFAGIRVVAVHLSLSLAERSRHLIRLLLVVRTAPTGCVLAGDLNEEPGGPTWRRLGLHLHDLTAGSGPTFPAAEPRSRIDAVLGTNDMVGSQAQTVHDDVARRASDHLPVVVEVRRT